MNLFGSKRVSNRERTLGQLMAAQSMLHVLPNREKLVEFIVEVIHSVPGAQWVGLCLRGCSEPMGDIDEGCQVCPGLKNLTNDKLDFHCGFSGREDILVIPLATTNRQYGFLQVGNDGSGELDEIRPFIKNFANAVAMSMENQWQRENPEAINVELENHRNHLEDRLKASTAELKKKNIALTEILGQLEFEKNQLNKLVSTNVNKLLIPLMQKLSQKATRIEKKYLTLLEKNLKEITSELGIQLSDKHLTLSQRELEICNMINGGLTTKVIADLLNLSVRTIETHRYNIRRKLQIVKTKINLTTYFNKV